MGTGLYPDRTLRRGDTEAFAVFLSNQEQFTGRKSVIDLSGCTISWTAGSITKTNSSGIAINLDQGLLSWVLSSSETNSLAGQVAHKLVILFPGSIVWTPFVGTLTMSG